MGASGSVLLVTPNEADSGLARGFLREHRVPATHCTSLSEAAQRLGADVECVVLVEEALVQPELGLFLAAVQAQPPWSDLPLLLIASQGSSLAALAESVFPESGNVTLLQRPLHPLSLVSAVKVALRARHRQHQVRELLEERSRAVRQRDEFLAMLAHELRNPLAPIRNAVYLMKDMPAPDPVFEKCRSMIEKQASHITRLVDDLLDVSRLELGKVELRMQPVDLNESATAAMEACLPIVASERHGIELRLSREPLGIQADPVRIEQVLGNLLVNAAKFTPADGAIRVETERQGEEAVVRVVDNGRGIRADMIDSVFDLFVQDERSLARSKGGLGIGLTLVRRLVELHGGRVAVSSDGVGRGATFEARFPLAAAGPGQAPAVDRRAHQRRRVLVVEDGDDIRDSLGMLLARWRHEVAFAADGTEGLAQARRLQPDVAIIDIGLPGMDGYEVARRIRAGPQPWARRVKLLALTGYGQSHDRRRALEAGFDDHLLKPVEPGVLEQLLLAD